MYIAVKEGLEKRRYLLFASPGAAKSLVSAAFFTERERPDETAMYKRRIVFSRAVTISLDVKKAYQVPILTFYLNNAIFFTHISERLVI